MRKLVVLLVAAVMFLGLEAKSYADWSQYLSVVGTGTVQGVPGSYQLIYDSSQNITWLDYTYQSSGGWSDAVNWANKLSVSVNGTTYSGWTLPSMADGPRIWSNDGTTNSGYNNITGELGHLFYSELGNKGYNDTNGNYQPGYWLMDTGPFKNLQPYAYWYGTELSAIPNYAWNFYFLTGCQDYGYMGDDYRYALAVYQGDVGAPVPEPSTLLLFGIGLAVLAGYRKFKA